MSDQSTAPLSPHISLSTESMRQEEVTKVKKSEEPKKNEIESIRKERLPITELVPSQTKMEFKSSQLKEIKEQDQKINEQFKLRSQPLQKSPSEQLKQRLKMIVLDQVLPSILTIMPEKIKAIMELEIEKLSLAKDKNLEATKTLTDTFREELPLPQMNWDKNTALVWRGLRCDQLIKMVINNSAGDKPVDAEVGPPSEEEVKDQVGERGRLPEFTYDKSVAEGFGTDAYVAVFKIDNKYLVKGSGVESGVVCKP